MRSSATLHGALDVSRALIRIQSMKTSLRLSCSRVGQPTRIREREWNKPNTSRSQSTTQMTTTAFKIDLILPAIGMKRFTSQSRTPTTIRATKTCIRGIAFYLSVYAARHFHAGPKDYCLLLALPGAENALHWLPSTKG